MSATIQRIVDNRAFLLGLDELYRDAMKVHEGGELLACAELVAGALGEPPADVPVEGYYSEEPELTRYFLLMRALQEVPLSRVSGVVGIPAFQRLLAVASSPIFGGPERVGTLLPKGIDPLSKALRAVPMPQWAVQRLTSTAAALARESDDFSLVGLAARAEDPVALAALRESVVLYAASVFGRALLEPRYQYIWEVEPTLAAAAQRFVDTFNGLFGPELPPAHESSAEVFWHASVRAHVIGRCVRIGQTDPPSEYYHWAIRSSDAHLSVHEFWSTRIVSTEDYRKGLLLGTLGRPLEA